MFPISLLTATLAVMPVPMKPITMTPEVAAKLQAIAFQAIRDDDVDTLKAYLDSGGPVNAPNPRGDTLLILAAYYGNRRAVELILARPGVNIEERNKMGLTALAGAAFRGHTEILEQLLKAKANPNAANGSGQTPLMFAALGGKSRAVEILLKAGAKPELRDRTGKDARTLAQEQGAEEVVRLLSASQAPQ